MTTTTKTRIAALGLTVLSVAGIAVASGVTPTSASVSSPVAVAAPNAQMPSTPAAPPAHKTPGNDGSSVRPDHTVGSQGRVTSEYDSPGVNLTVRNNSSDVIAVLFRYDGGPSNWTNLYPGESATDSSVNNDGIYNSFVYFFSNNTRVKLKANMPPPSIGYRPNLTIDGKFRSLDFDTVVTDTAAGHNYKVTRQSNVGDTDRAALTLELV